MGLHIVTDRISPEEECYGLRLAHVGGRYVEQVFVVRGDTIAKYETDLGPSDDWADIPPLLMPSFGENTVASMRDWGERHRHNPKWAERLKEMRASSTLIPDLVRQTEQIDRISRNRSVLAPGLQAQRNSYPREAVDRKYRDEIAEETNRRSFYPHDH